MKVKQTLDITRNTAASISSNALYIRLKYAHSFQTSFLTFLWALYPVIVDIEAQFSLLFS